MRRTTAKKFAPAPKHLLVALLLLLTSSTVVESRRRVTVVRMRRLVTPKLAEKIRKGGNVRTIGRVGREHMVHGSFGSMMGKLAGHPFKRIGDSLMNQAKKRLEKRLKKEWGKNRKEIMRKVLKELVDNNVKNRITKGDSIEELKVELRKKMVDEMKKQAMLAAKEEMERQKKLLGDGKADFSGLSDFAEKLTDNMNFGNFEGLSKDLSAKILDKNGN